MSDARDFDALYPEHAKLRPIADDSHNLGFLIERLQGHGISLGHWQARTSNTRIVCRECDATTGDGDDVGHEEFVPWRRGIQETLALLFEIDYAALMAEKDAMYAELSTRAEAST